MQTLLCNYWKLISYSISVSDITALKKEIKEKENQLKGLLPYFVYSDTPQCVFLYREQTKTPSNTLSSNTVLHFITKICQTYIFKYFISTPTCCSASVPSSGSLKFVLAKDTNY
jgi:hypothetical protein